MEDHLEIHCQTCPSRVLGVFCQLKGEALDALDLHKTMNAYKKGQIVFYEGNESFGLYCIEAGRIKLYKTTSEGRQQIVRISGPGSLLGYRSLFAEEPYHATAEALEDAKICFFDQKAIFSLLKQNPSLLLNILKKFRKNYVFPKR